MTNKERELIMKNMSPEQRALSITSCLLSLLTYELTSNLALA